MARHFEARLPEGGDDFVAIPHRAVLDALEQVVPDQVARGGFEPEPGPQPGRLDVGSVAGLLHPGPRWVVRPTPAVFMVESVAERSERLLPAGRRNVEAPPGFEVAPRGEDVDVRAAAAFAVQHSRPCEAVGFEPRPSRPFELIENRTDLGVGGRVVGCPGNHARGVLVI